MIMAGPRALQRLGQDYRGLAWLGKTNEGGLPANAIVFMGLVALGFLWTSTFEQILLFAASSWQQIRSSLLWLFLSAGGDA